MRFSPLLLLIGFTVFADVIPPERTADWRKGKTTGVFGGIPSNYTEWTNFITAGADAGSASAYAVTNCQPLLQTLVNACPDDKYIYVPAGRYRWSNSVALHANSRFSIRGAGRTNSIFFVKTAILNLDNISRATSRVKGALAKGATNVTIFSATDFAPYIGNNVYVDSRNVGHTNLHVISVDNADRSMYQVSRLVAVSNGTNLTIWPPLVYEHPEAAEPWLTVNVATQSKLIGFEEFGITGTNEFTGEQMATDNLISIFGGQDIWFKGLSIRDPHGFHFNFTGNLNVEIRDSDFISTLSGANTAVILMGGDSGDLVENNYSVGGSPFVEANASSGNVVAYNYCTNAVSNDFHVGNPYDNHSPHSMMNLWEGNYGTMYQSDGYFGSSSHQTLFRNWFTGYDPIKTGLPRAVDLDRWSTYYNIVGNTLGDPRSAMPWYSTTNRFHDQTSPMIYRFGYPNPGNSSYAAVQTPQTDWRYPGAARIGGVISNATELTTNLIGNFTNVVAGDQLTIQSALNTNLYYPFQTNYPRLMAFANGTVSNLFVTVSIWVTNLDTLYRIGPEAYQQFFLDDNATHLLTGNYDRTNNAVLWDTSGTSTDSNLPPSLYLSDSQWTNYVYALVNPTNGVSQNNLTNWIARQRFEAAEAGGGGEPEPPAPVRSLRAVRTTAGRVQ